VLRHAVHDLTHHLQDAGRGLHAIGAGAPVQEGTVAHLAASDGGVPKLPVDEVEVGRRGLVGDRQADRRNHGRPLQALCLWSTEVIAALQAEGHPIGPGLAGENITVEGIDWTTIRTGVQLRIGQVLCEISAFSTPCAKNAQWFADREFRRMDHDLHPGWSRAYAWVREPGTIRRGDRVVVEP
jgi:MOSC domain-containing protein YiiM